LAAIWAKQEDSLTESEVQMEYWFIEDFVII